jgi:hypothetical protein
MGHRTQLTQQDEALRQVRLDDTVRNGLRQIADTLAHTQPDQLMTGTQRHNVAFRTADATHPHDRDAAAEYERQLLQRMPWVDGRQITRGEYALWLHKTSWSA